jgi:hypothetical protein
VTGLKKDVKLTVKDLHLAAGLKAAMDPDLLLAIVQEHKVEEAAPAAAVGAVEPEVIKKPKEAEEGAEGEAKGEKKDAAPKKEEKK